MQGVRFAVWAPNARRVSVVGDFNIWDGRRHPMRLRHPAGVWEIFIPRLQAGAAYKYEILGPTAILPLKADPMALATQTATRHGIESRVAVTGRLAGSHVDAGACAKAEAHGAAVDL